MESKIAIDILVKLDQLKEEYRSKFGYNGKKIEMISDGRFVNYWHNKRIIFFYDKKTMKFIKKF